METRRKIPKVFLFCLQRTGSNLVQRGMDDNFKLPITNAPFYEWKHGTPPPIDETLNRFVLICTRNPYAWLVSCYRYFIKEHGRDTTICSEFRKEMTFKDFLRSRSYSMPNPMRRYSIMHELWLGRAYDRRQRAGSMVINSEQMLTPDGQVNHFLDLAKRVYGDTWVAPERKDIKTYNKVISNTTKETDEVFDRGQYKHHEYLKHFDEEDLQHVREHLDPEICRTLGYGILDPKNPLAEDLDSGF